MADKRTDKDDNVKEDRSWQFIQEKIVLSRYQEGRSSDISDDLPS